MFERLLKRAKELYYEGEKDYSQLHNIAEVGLHLPKTVGYVRERLLEMGYEPEDVGGGLIATIGQGEKCILLRADMDALAFGGEEGSEMKNIHACGHDMHTAMLLLAARLFREFEKDLSLRVALCFQPGEETLNGAKAMIDAGLLERTKPEFAVMLHVLINTDFETGTVVIPPAGIGASGADFFKVTVTGKGCHGSMPYMGRDPIIAIVHMITALSSLTAREIKGSEGDLLTVGKIVAGRVANAIPEKGEFFGTLRSYSDENREYLINRLCEICTNTAKAFGVNARVEFTSGAPSFINSKKLTDLSKKAFEKAFPSPYVVPEGTKGGGSEDFSYVSRLVPSLMLCISAGSIEEGYREPLHSPFVRFNKDAIPYGGAVYAAMAFCFEDNE